MRATVGWASTAGVRPDNQDCVLVGGMLSVGDVAQTATFSVGPRITLLVAVLDGMGGHAGGGVASRVGAAVLGGSPVPRTDEELVERSNQAHRVISNLGATLPGLAGLGTTLVGFLIDEADYRVFHTGDSTAYRLVDGIVGQLTEPHRAEDPRRPGGMVLTRCLGVGSELAPDIESFPLRRAVRLLACSDGVGEVLTSDALRDALATGDPLDASVALIEAATDAGSRDNMTAVVVDLDPAGI